MNSFDKSIGILKDSNDPVSLAIVHNNKAVVELKEKKFREAFKSLRSAIMLIEPLIFEKIKHYSEQSLRENSQFQEKLHILLISYKNFSVVHKKMGNKNYAKTVLDHFQKMCEKLLPKDSPFNSKINLNSSSTGSSQGQKNINEDDKANKKIRPSTSNPYTIGYQFRKKQNRRIFQDREGITNNQRSKDDIKMTVNHADLMQRPSTGILTKPQPVEEDTPSSNINKFEGTKDIHDSFSAAPAPENTKVLMSTLSEISKQITQEKEELSKEWEKLKLSIKEEQEERERFKQLKEQELREIEQK